MIDVFGLAAVWQRLCLKAVVADIAEIVGHEMCTFLWQSVQRCANTETKPLSNVKVVTQKQRMQKIHRGAE